MATIQESHEFSGKSVDDCFQAACRAYPKANFTVWKQRPLGWLVMARREQNGVTVESNIAARPGIKSVLTIGVDCPTLQHADLRPLADELLAAIKKELGV